MCSTEQQASAWQPLLRVTTLQSCASDSVLRFVNATGRIVSKAGDKCLTIQPAVGSYPGAAAVAAKAVLAECAALPANRQQFQFSVRKLALCTVI